MLAAEMLASSGSTSEQKVQLLYPQF